MTLGYQTTQPLSIPEDAFNDNDLATIVVTGSIYNGDMWIMKAVSQQDQATNQTAVIGSFETNDALALYRPDLVVEAAEVWMKKECDRLGFEVIHTVDHNHTFPADEAPSCAGIVLYVDRRKEDPSGLASE